MNRKGRFLLMLTAISLVMSGCMRNSTGNGRVENTWVPAAELPEIPDDLEKGENGIPVLRVYDVASEKLEQMDLEDYVMGVVAGEMKNDWPLEALKAQAILARTFVLKFCDTKDSRYEDADISTDVSEAQAYAPQSINARIRQAVEETRGEVMSYDGEYPYAWFFAHAGGMTELPSVSLDYNDEDPEYLSAVESPDSEKAPEDVKQWEASFTPDQVQKACAELGVKTGSVETVEIGEKGASGRAKTLRINGETVSAPSFRLKIGANVLKSTLIENIDVQEGRIVFTGRGFGHGVGMSQWGAYALAEEGKQAEEIVQHYFRNINIVKLW